MKRVLIAAALTGLLATSVADAAFKWRKPKEPATLADLKKRPLPAPKAESVQSDPERAAVSYQQFLQIDETDPAMRAQALRRLGDLKLATADELRADDETSAAASAATREAIAAYRQLLQEYPGRADAGEVQYQLARAYEGLGDTNQALAELDALVRSSPAAALYPEAQFRRGEIFFSNGRYAEAEQAYAAVIKGAGKRSDFYAPALYKHGWSLFKQSRDEEASQSFLAVLDEVLTSGGELRETSGLTRAQREMADDSMRAMSITFASAEGVQSLQASLNRHGLRPYEPQLYRSLGDLYLEKERYQDAAETYRAFAKRQPMHREAPLLLVAATDAYERGGFMSLVLDGKRELVAGYGPTSAFWQANRTNLDPRVVAAVEKNLLDLAQHHHALAKKNGRAEDLNEAARWYRDYLAGFDDRPQAPATRLLLADLLFDGQRFAEAAGEYERAAYSYKVNPEAPRAGYAALVSYDKALPALPDAERTAWQQRAMDSSIRFADHFPEHPEVPAVLTRATRTLFDAGDRVRAESVAQRLLALGPRAKPEQQRVAWTVLASTYFDSARYPEAENAYRELVARIPAGDAERTAVVERLAASVYRQAEARQAAGDVTGAVDQFLRVAQVAPDSSIRSTAEFDAATLLVNAQQWERAASVLENFRRAHPGHELVPEATRKLAVAYLNTGRPRDAAVELERVAARDGEDAEVRRTSLWEAAELYAQGGDTAGATRVYTDYVKRYPAPYDAAIEARHELAELALAAKDTNGRQRWLGEIISADAAAGATRTDRSRFLAAHASLELAQPKDDLARALRLTVPLDRALASKKQAMEQALTSYNLAAQYGVTDVTTQSTYAMADLYRHLGKSLLESERPHELSADEREQYDVLLEEQAFPFEEKAIEVHEINARRAAEGVYDDWVKRSFGALAEIKPARFARPELDSDLTPAPVVAAATGAENAKGKAAKTKDAPAAAPDISAQLIAASTSLAAGRDDEARAVLEEALRLDPANATAANRLGIAQRHLGRFAAARTSYERAIAIDPAQTAPRRNLAILLDLYMNQPAAALPHYEKSLELAGGSDKELQAWLVELRGRLGQVQRTAETKP
jgi:tetratricopeptide (TPR) repeat protein